MAAVLKWLMAWRMEWHARATFASRAKPRQRLWQRNRRHANMQARAEGTMRGTAKAVEGPHDPAGGCLTTRTTQKFHSSSGLRAVARHKKHILQHLSLFSFLVCVASLHRVWHAPNTPSLAASHQAYERTAWHLYGLPSCGACGAVRCGVVRYSARGTMLLLQATRMHPAPYPLPRGPWAWPA